MCIGIIKMLGSDAVCSGHLQFDRMRYVISSGVSRSAWPRCGVGTQELTSMGTTEACANSKCNRQAQAGRKQSTVQSLMVYRHRCVMFMDAVQTESSSLKRRWKGTGGEKKCASPSVEHRGYTEVILQQRWQNLFTTAGAHPSPSTGARATSYKPPSYICTHHFVMMTNKISASSRKFRMHFQNWQKTK